jgi:hypothetical protein
MAEDGAEAEVEEQPAVLSQDEISAALSDLDRSIDGTAVVSTQGPLLGLAALLHGRHNGSPQASPVYRCRPPSVATWKPVQELCVLCRHGPCNSEPGCGGECFRCSPIEDWGRAALGQKNQPNSTIDLDVR